MDESADEAQREALLKILKGESTAPGATHFFVYNSTMSEVLDPIFAPIELAIDVDAREASIAVADLVESKGTPITNPDAGEPYHAAVNLPNGFEYTTAQMGWATRQSPTDAPGPVTRFNTPGGSPASSDSFTSLTALKGVDEAGLKTKVLPHTRAGAIFHAGMARGKFHGVMMATTPSGLRTV